MARSDARNKRPPLDENTLRELALAYVGRFATSRARLANYLARKLRERGWSGENPPDPAAMAERLAELRYVDDAGYAVMKGGAMARRGLGPRRIRAGLQADGVGEADRQEAEERARAEIWDAACVLARRKRAGPFAASPAAPDLREKQLAAFIRAGHDFTTARLWVDALPGQPPERPDEAGS